MRGVSRRACDLATSPHCSRTSPLSTSGVCVNSPRRASVSNSDLSTLQLDLRRIRNIRVACVSMSFCCSWKCFVSNRCVISNGGMLNVANGRILLFNDVEQDDFTTFYVCLFLSEKQSAAITCRRRVVVSSAIRLWQHGVVSMAVRRISTAKRASIPLFACWLAAWVFPALSMGTEANVSASAAPILQSEEPRVGHPETPLAVELLSLIKKLDPLRVTIPYVDYRDEALAAQTVHRKLKRRAGFRRSRGRRNSYKAASGWTGKGSSAVRTGGRSRSSPR